MRLICTITFVKKPRQHYGVSYVFCLGMAQMNQQKDSALVLYGYLSGKIKSGPDFIRATFRIAIATIIQRPLPVVVKVKAKVKVEMAISHGYTFCKLVACKGKPTAGNWNNKMLFWQVLLDGRFATFVDCC